MWDMASRIQRSIRDLILKAAISDAQCHACGHAVRHGRNEDEDPRQYCEHGRRKNEPCGEHGGRYSKQCDESDGGCYSVIVYCDCTAEEKVIARLLAVIRG